MVNYRRIFIPSGMYFFTVTLQDRRSSYLIKYVNLLRESFIEAKNKKPYKTDAIVVLPDHLHAIWTLPKNDSDYADRWRQIKSIFTKKIIKEEVELKKNNRGEYNLWQRRFWEHAIRDENDFEQHVNYIHYNPVKHGYVDSPADWQYSSIHRYIKMGKLPANWASDVISDRRNFGE